MNHFLPSNTFTPESKTTPNDAHRARSAIRGGIFGNYVDQFDIFLPVIALAPAAAHLYGSENLARNAGLIFVATLIGRPLGSAIFGPISDRIGRIASTKIAILGVAITTLLIACIPGSRGTLTLFSILGLRLAGGIFIGGEYTSAIPLAMEWTSPPRRGLVSGFIMWMSPWANATIATLVLILLKILSPTQYATWGWRIPFLLGALMAFVMLAYFRAYVTDSPAWTVSAKNENPLRSIFVSSNRRSLLQVSILMSGMWIFTYMSVAVLSGQLKAQTHLNYQDVALTLMFATGASAISMVACGQLSTSIGRRKFFIIFGTSSTILAPLTYIEIFKGHALASTVVLVAVLQVVTVSVYGPVAAYLTERFPTAVRSSGYGMAYSLSIVIPSLYPYYLPPLQRIFGNHGTIEMLLGLAGVLVAIGASIGPETFTIDA